MAEISSPPSEPTIPEETALSERLAPTLTSEAEATTLFEGEEEPFEEFVIEDFTIDGICGVY